MASMVPETITGMRHPSSVRTRSMPAALALTLRVSWRRLDKQNVGAALRQALGLCEESLDQIRKCDAAGNRNRLGGGPHGPGHEARTRRSGETPPPPGALIGGGELSSYASAASLLRHTSVRAPEAVGGNHVAPASR